MNIVDLYNSYTYAVVGEEYSGFPALGAFEAMACGCILLAEPSCYQGTGAEPGTHFVAHSGELHDIIDKIKQKVSLPDASACSKLIESMRPRATYIKWNDLLSKLP